MDILRSSPIERFAYAEKLSKNNSKVDSLLDIWISFWHDILLQSGNSGAPLQNIDREQDIQLVLKEVDLETARETVNLFRRAHQLLEQNANTRLTLENLMLQLPGIKS
jgi:hypothetical protein